MSKISLVVILGLSVVTTIVATIIDSLVNHTLLSGESGFPFKYIGATLFGRGDFNITLMILNIIFWFIIIFVIWQLIQKYGIKKKKK